MLSHLRPKTGPTATAAAAAVAAVAFSCVSDAASLPADRTEDFCAEELQLLRIDLQREQQTVTQLRRVIGAIERVVHPVR